MVWILWHIMIMSKPMKYEKDMWQQGGILKIEHIHSLRFWWHKRSDIANGDNTEVKVYDGQNGKTMIKRCLVLEFSRGQVICTKVWGCPWNLMCGELPQQKVYPRWRLCHDSFMLWILQWRSLDRSVNPGWWIIHFVANHMAPFP